MLKLIARVYQQRAQPQTCEHTSLGLPLT